MGGNDRGGGRGRGALEIGGGYGNGCGKCHGGRCYWMNMNPGARQ